MKFKAGVINYTVNTNIPQTFIHKMCKYPEMIAKKIIPNIFSTVMLLLHTQVSTFLPGIPSSVPSSSNVMLL